MMDEELRTNDALGTTGNAQNEAQDDGSKADRLVLRTEGLVKRYGKRTVVNDVSFDVKRGEIVGLLGPNGAGKTTSFYMTTGLVIPNGGHVFLGDEEITTYPVYKRARAGIGYLPQEASVFRKMSVEDNIMSVLEMTGKPHQYRADPGRRAAGLRAGAQPDPRQKGWQIPLRRKLRRVRRLHCLRHGRLLPHRAVGKGGGALWNFPRQTSGI